MRRERRGSDNSHFESLFPCGNWLGTLADEPLLWNTGVRTQQAPSLLFEG